MSKILNICLRILLLMICFSGTDQGQSIPTEILPAWETLSEKTDYRQTPRYQEVIDFSKRLDMASNLIFYRSFGKSGEGRDLPLLIASKDSAFSPSAAKKSGRAIVLIQACIHAGESDGKDAGLALMRDIAITKTRADLLENAIILFIPIYNVDGHEIFGRYNRINQNGPEEMGWRATSAGLNLNRDYMKADAPETRAWLKLWNEWKPDFFIDCHVTDGADFRYNLTYEYAHLAEVSQHIKGWMAEYFEKRVVPKVESEGNLVTHYLEFNGRDISKGVSTFIATPRFATGYVPLRNRPGLLIETHMLKDYRSRVRGTYDLLRYTIEETGKNKVQLFAAIKDADAETRKIGLAYDEKRNFPLRLEITDKSTPFLLKGIEYRIDDSEISGTKRIIYGTKPLDITIPKFDEARISEAIAPPLYYVIPPQWQKVIEVIGLHGISYKRLKKPLNIEVESYRFSEVRWSAASFEGRNTLNFKVNPVKETRTYPPGSVIVPLDQDTANVAIHLLEPRSPDSFVSWGVFNPIFEQKEFGEGYVLEKLAREMLAKDENLRKEFAEKMKSPEFAASPSARLRFFYDRSPYFDSNIGLYPVGRITKPLTPEIFK